jgi:Methyltransferase domain
MAKLFPKAQIVGMDSVKPSCPQPSHFQFIEGRTPSSLPFNDDSFDYVHQRCLGTVIPTRHWQGIINELVRITQLGGWVELMEYGPYVNPGPATEQFCLWWQQVLAKRGIDLKQIEQLGAMLQNAGLEHVQQKTISIPLFGTGRATDGMRTNLLAMIQMARTSILALGIGASTFVEVTSSLPEEWQKHQTAYQFHVAYGQRPNIFFQASLGQHSNTRTSFMPQRSHQLGTEDGGRKCNGEKISVLQG